MTPDVPVVSGLTYTDLGDNAETATPVMRAVMKMLKPRQRSLRTDLVDRIQEIHADPALGLTLFIADDRQADGYRSVTLGFDDFDQKYARLQTIDAFLRKNRRYAGFRSINLDNLNRIVVSPITADSAAGVRKEV
jgi:cell division protein FtsQ